MSSIEQHPASYYTSGLEKVSSTLLYILYDRTEKSHGYILKQHRIYLGGCCRLNKGRIMLNNGRCGKVVISARPITNCGRRRASGLQHSCSNPGPSMLPPFYFCHRNLPKTTTESFPSATKVIQSVLDAYKTRGTMSGTY
jgi:hypothetical protein